MSDDERAIQVYREFKGKTVGELIAFFQHYPEDMPVMFTDRDVLVARAKGPDLILRLDPKEEHESD